MMRTRKNPPRDGLSLGFRRNESDCAAFSDGEIRFCDPRSIRTSRLCFKLPSLVSSRDMEPHSDMTGGPVAVRFDDERLGLLAVGGVGRGPGYWGSRSSATINQVGRALAMHVKQKSKQRKGKKGTLENETCGT